MANSNIVGKEAIIEKAIKSSGRFASWPTVSLIPTGRVAVVESVERIHINKISSQANRNI